jgi:glycosyltransferase involved in cell wall biosynthesis
MELSIDIGKLRERKIFIATPMYGGMCGGQYTKSTSDLIKLAAKYGVDVETFYLFNESLITRARNYCVDEFLRSSYTHLMFIDADIGFDPNDVLALAAIADPETDKDIVCGPYPKKTISWEKIKQAVDKGYADENPQNLKNYVGDFVFNPVSGENQIALNEPVEVLEGGTGFMMIQRKAFEKYEAAYPEFKYLPDHVRTANFDGSREIMAYFDCIIDPKSKRYLSEDYMFCQWARNAGIKVWMAPWMRLQHMGSYFFGGSLADLANVGASATADPTQNIKQ